MISDDDLLLYYYRELDAAERARIGAALGEQPELARRLHTLVARLDAAAAMPEVPVPPEALQRWQNALGRAARVEPHAAPARPSFFLGLRWPAAVAATAVVAVIATLYVVRPPSPGPMANTPATTQPAGTEDASAYENGLKFHLASTERRLAGLSEATPEERARLIESIIGQNRIYALAAERAGEPQLARVLRAFSPVLESLGNEDHEKTASGIAQLSFELRVMQARLGSDASPPSNTL